MPGLTPFRGARSPASRKRRLRLRFMSRLLLGCLVLASLIALFVRLDTGPGADVEDDGLRWLASEIPCRPFEPRLTTDFRPPSCEPEGAPTSILEPTRCRCPPPTPEELGELAPRFRRVFRSLPPPKRAGIEALGHLLSYGQEGALERAENRLSRALQQQPDEPRLLSDLAALAYLRALEEGDARQLIRGLSLAERAAHLAPDLKEARFNRALILERLLPRGAARAWEEALTLNPNEDWHREVERRLERLAEAPEEANLWEAALRRLPTAAASGDVEHLERIAREHPFRVRRHLEAVVLPAWVAARAGGDAAAAQVTSREGQRIGEALFQATGDSLWRDAWAHLGGAGGWEGKRLEAGLSALVEGMTWIGRGDFQQAETPLEQARERLGRAGNPLGLWAAYLLLRCAYQRQELPRIVREAEELLAREEAATRPLLVGHVGWVLGTAQLGLGRPGEALLSYRQSLRAFSAAGDELLQATLHLRLAGTAADLGEEEAAWRHRYRALALLQAWPGHLEYRVALAELVFGSLALEAPEAALALQREAVELARESGNPVALNLAHRHLGVIQGRVGRTDSARASFAEARRHADEIPDPGQRQTAQTAIDFATGEALIDTDPYQVAVILDGVVDRFRRQSLQLLLADALHLRARARLAVGDRDGAELDLEEALAELEVLRSVRDRGQHQVRLLDRHRDLYDLMVSFQVDERHDAAEAQLALERGRARLLLDSLGQIESSAEGRIYPSGLPLLPRRFTDLQEELPAGVRVLQYHLQADRLLIWTLARDGLELTVEAVPAAQLRQLVEEVTQPDREADLAVPLAELYDHLIRPVAGELGAGQPLVLVPEGALFQVPFGALRQRETGRYLLEEHLIAVAPSLNSLVGLLPYTGEIAAGAGVLAVADPAFHPELFQGLQRLPAARREGELIARLFPGSRLLVGQAATREGFLSAAGRFEVIHLASHAFADPAAPFRSRLVLAPAEGDDGVLYAWELLGADFARTRLAVLAACDTAGASSRSEGVVGLVWPFLAAGVPQVLATVRPVDDRDTEALMGRFYPLLATGLDPWAALRQAQREALSRDDREPGRAAVWASFQLYGAPLALTEPAARQGSIHEPDS